MQEERRCRAMRSTVRFLIVVAVGILGCAVCTAGQKNADHVTPDLRALIEKYDLTVVDKLPVGVNPLVVTSLRGLQEAIEGFRAERSLVTTIAVQDGPALEALGTYYSPRNLHFSDPKDYMFWHYYFNLDAVMWIGVSGSFHWIDHIGGLRVYLSGLHPGVYLEDPWTDSLVEPDCQYAWVMGNGTINLYLIFKGTTILASDAECLMMGVPLH
jgi:hypothetical protein